MPLLLTWFTIQKGLVDVLKGLAEPPLMLSLSVYGKTEAFVRGPSVGANIYSGLIEEQGSKASVVGSDLIQCKYFLYDSINCGY